MLPRDLLLELKIPTPINPEQLATVAYPYQSAVPIVSPVQERDIDLTADIADKDAQIEVLEALLSCYENNPLIINKFVVCQYETLMNIIKVLTGAEKVEFSAWMEREVLTPTTSRHQSQDLYSLKNHNHQFRDKNKYKVATDSLLNIDPAKFSIRPYPLVLH